MTPFSNLNDRFLRKITDTYIFEKLNFNEIDIVNNMLEGYMLSAIPKFTKCKTDLSNRDDVLKVFNNTLSELEEEILSMLMVLEWIEPQINNIMILKQVLNDKDFKTYAQGQHLHELLALKEQRKQDIDLLIIQYSFDTSDIKTLLGSG